MPPGHVILLANFYGSYLPKSKFRANAIVNNAGIEQLATIGIEKVKQVKANVPTGDEIYVLVVAGLTDVLIKSVEEGKNKLEITPNSIQLIETKMQWAQTVLNEEGATVIWAVMPPISLRMYHKTEGWNINNIPGMSDGLDKEQRSLNNLMLNYRLLCLKLTTKEARRVINGPYFTDLVTEMSVDRSSMHLNTSYFEKDGISPIQKLIANWTIQINKIFQYTDQKPLGKRDASPVPLMSLGDARRKSDPWALPPPKVVDEMADRGLKRNYDTIKSAPKGVHDMGRQEMRGYGDRDRRDYRDRDYGQFEKRSRDYSPTHSQVPNLLRVSDSLESSRNRGDGPSKLNRPATQAPDQMATAMQLLAATMQLGGGQAGNVQTVINALMAQQQKDQREAEEKSRREEERAHAMRKRVEEEKMQAVRKQLEEAHRQESIKRMEELKRRDERQREELRWREEEKRREERLMEERHRIEARRREDERLREIELQKRRVAEENRLRELQIAAKLAMEQQRNEEQRRQANLLQQQQAQMALMAVTKQVRDQIAQKPSNLPLPNAVAVKPNAGSALDRINQKLKSDREKKQPLAVRTGFVSSDPTWEQPVILFSFLNRTNERKPLRGVFGPKFGKGAAKAISDYRSRGQVVYNQPGTVPPSIGLLKIKVRRSGELTEFENRVANFNNRIMDMIDEGNALLSHGRKENYHIRREMDDPKVAAKFSNTPTVPKEETKDQTPTADTSTSSVVEVVAKKDKDTKKRNSESSRPVKDLRHRLEKPASRRERSSTPADSKQKTRDSAPPSTSSKPRWDKSDESEDELLWDDDPVPIKPLVDDDEEVELGKVTPAGGLSEAPMDVADSPSDLTMDIPENASKDSVFENNGVTKEKEEPEKEATNKKENLVTSKTPVKVLSGQAVVPPKIKGSVRDEVKKVTIASMGGEPSVKEDLVASVNVPTNLKGMPQTVNGSAKSPSESVKESVADAAFVTLDGATAECANSGETDVAQLFEAVDPAADDFVTIDEAV